MLSMGAFLSCTTGCCLLGACVGDRYCPQELACRAKVDAQKKGSLGKGPVVAAGISRGRPCDAGGPGGEASQGSLAPGPSFPGGRSPHSGPSPHG